MEISTAEFLGDLALLGVGFFLGILSSALLETTRLKREKNNLVDLFITDIRENWEKVDELRAAPSKSYFVRIRPSLKGATNLEFHGEPEYEFEVHNVRLYEVEGLRLLPHLKLKTRALFWETYTLMRDTEAVRTIICKTSSESKDINSYKRMFVQLVDQLALKLVELSNALKDEMPLLRKLWRAIKNQ